MVQRINARKITWRKRIEREGKKKSERERKRGARGKAKKNKKGTMVRTEEKNGRYNTRKKKKWKR